MGTNDRPSSYACFSNYYKFSQRKRSSWNISKLKNSSMFIVRSSFTTCAERVFPRYLRALAAMYIRMTFRPVDVYELLEPLLKDYRKLRTRNMGSFFLNI
jgi:hypothetical protein